MRSRLLAVVLCAGCNQLFGIATYPPIDGGATGYRRQITIHHDGPAQTSFPVSITLDHDAGLAAHARADGMDLVFGDDTQRYDCEIVSYADGTLDAWVNVPSIAAGPATTTFWLMYGGALRSSDPTATWPAPFVGVWHLSDAAAGARDSSPQLIQLVAGPAAMGPWTSPALITGIAGSARDFDGSAQQLCAADPGSVLEFGTTSFSYSMWVDVAPAAPTGLALFKGGSSAGLTGFDFEISAGEAEASIADGANSVAAGVSLPLTGAWNQVEAVVDRVPEQLLAAVDGQANVRDTTGIGSVSQPSQSLCLTTNDGQTTYPYLGQIDELRIYSAAMSTDWFALEYQNLALRDQVITIGPEQPR